jgi:hypothetical protein
MTSPAAQNYVRASGASAGGIHVVECLGQWRAFFPARPATRPTETFFEAASRHEREVNYFACVPKSRRGLLAPLPGEDFWRYAWAMVRIAPAPPATRPTTTKNRWVFQFRLSCSRGESYTTIQSEARNFFKAQQRFLLNLPLGATFFSKLRAPHRGTSLIMLVCSASGGRILARCILLWALGRTLRFRFDLALKTGKDSTQVNCKMLCVF